MWQVLGFTLVNYSLDGQLLIGGESLCTARQQVFYANNPAISAPDMDYCVRVRIFGIDRIACP